MAAILHAVSDACVSTVIHSYLRSRDVVQILVDSRLRHMHLHRQRLVIDLRQLSQQVTAQRQRLPVLFVLLLTLHTRLHFVEKEGETTLQALRQKRQFARLRPLDVLLAHLDFGFCVHVHGDRRFDNRLH